MTIDEAREILLKVKGKILLHFESCHAEGFLEGWNAAINKSAEIATDYVYGDSAEQQDRADRIQAKILNLSGSAEGEEGK